MTNRSKNKGTWMETHSVDYMRRVFHDDEHTIHRETLHGSKDIGDISGVYINGEPCVIEVKNHRKMELTKWMREAEIEAGNADAPYHAVLHKAPRVGAANMGKQFVTMTLDQFCKMIGGNIDAVQIKEK